MKNVLGLLFFCTSFFNNTSQADESNPVMASLEELTYRSWVDAQNWWDLVRLPGEWLRKIQEEDADYFFEQSIQLMETILSPIGHWAELSDYQQVYYLTGVGYYFVLGMIALKLSVVLERKLSHEIRFRVLRRFGFRIGPLEPKDLPGFLRSRSYSDFIRSHIDSQNLSRRHKRWLKAYFRAFGIYRSTGELRYKVNRPSLPVDWSVLEDEFEKTYQKYRAGSLENRWAVMPSWHKPHLPFLTPHIDETLKAIVDFSMDALPEDQQRKLILYLEKVAVDFNRSGRSQSRMPWSFSLRRLWNQNESIFKVWLSFVRDAVRADQRYPFLNIVGIESEPVTEEDSERLRKKLNERFSLFACKESFLWLGGSNSFR